MKYQTKTLFAALMIVLMFSSFMASTVMAQTTAKVDAGSFLHTCWLKTDGSIACWGDNTYGQGTPPAGTFTDVSAGDLHTCAVKSDGSLACWGDNSSNQTTGIPSGTFTQVSAGSIHTCALKSDGSIACWGGNNYGQTNNIPSGTFTQISAGYYHTCAVKNDGTLACWGAGTTNTGVVPHFGQASPPGGTFTQVGAGGYHTCGVKSDSTVACWGYNNYGQATAAGGNFAHVSGGARHTCGLKTDNTIACWGAGTTNTGSWPHYGQSIPASGTFAQVNAGDLHTCALTSGGAVICWGDNTGGQAATYTISGHAGTTGVTLSYTDGTSKTATSDGSGNYAFKVAHNWSGTVTPSKAGLNFSPASRSYSNVSANQTSQNYLLTATFYSIGSEDGWVLESSETSGVGGSNSELHGQFMVGDNASDEQFRGILSFDTSPLADTAVIDSVKFRIKQWSQNNDNPFDDSHLHIDIMEGKFGTSFGLQNMDFEDAADGPTVSTVPRYSTPDANDWYSSGFFNATGEGLVNLTNKTQLRIRFGQDDNDDGSADFIKFYSGDYPGGDHPELIITYTVP